MMDRICLHPVNAGVYFLVYPQAGGYRRKILFETYLLSAILNYAPPGAEQGRSAVCLLSTRVMLLLLIIWRAVISEVEIMFLMEDWYQAPVSGVCLSPVLPG